MSYGSVLHGPPVFEQEGPTWYDQANAWYGYWAYFGWHQTRLASGNEASFRAWVSNNSVPFDPNEHPTDYDMRGFWYHVITTGGHWDGAHFPDYYKTPYDTTFSHESRYARSGTPFGWLDDSHLVGFHTGRLMFAPSGSDWQSWVYANRGLYRAWVNWGHVP
jgi:hypothetical protein